MWCKRAFTFVKTAYCIAGNFCQEFNCFRQSNFLTELKSWLNFSRDWATKEQTSDDRRLTKINSWRTAWRSLLTKFFADESFLPYSSKAKVFFSPSPWQNEELLICWHVPESRVLDDFPCLSQLHFLQILQHHTALHSSTHYVVE